MKLIGYGKCVGTEYTNLDQLFRPVKRETVVSNDVCALYLNSLLDDCAIFVCLFVFS